mmetsp:Transcript_66359/g.115476  ORF Transcript_66359/g.115476 Transcript_66359/m.115476 type:complete len:682 (-) Transcript_66359:72-2117(-)
MTADIFFIDFESAASVLLQAAHSLRYELTCGVVLFALWFMGTLTGLPTDRRKLISKLGVQEPEKRSPMEERQWTTPRSRPQARYTRTTPDLNRDLSAAHSTADLISHLNSMDQALLCDPSWVVQQVTQLCRAHFQHALAVYRTALKAGLKLQDVPPAQCQQIFATLVISSIRINHMNEVILLLKDLRHAGLGVSASLFASISKLCTSKHLFAECLRIYDFVAEDSTFSLTDKSIWSCLLFCAIESRAYQRCEHFFGCLKACGTPSHKDYGNMVRLASLHGDWQLSLRLIQEMRSGGVEIDCVIYNTSLATCVSADQVDQGRMLLEDMVKAQGVADVITYNTLMKGYAKAGRMSECFELFELLQKRNLAPSQVTYGILLDGCINDNLLDKAAKVFNDMVSGGCAMNTVLFTTLIKGFARAGEVDQAMKVYQQMRAERSVPPDLITFSILIKSNCDFDRLDKALKLLEAMLELGLKPDEVIFNNLLAGCTRQSNAELGKRLYADMIASGIRPSNATFSILIRLYHQCKMLEEAVEMLRKEPALHKVDPEPRLFLQLIQSCIRERQGRRAVEVYEMLVAKSMPAVVAHSSMITTCIKLNMFDTAAEILAKAAECGARVDAGDANSLLEGAVKKKKFAVGATCVVSMELLGITPDPRWLAQMNGLPPSDSERQQANKPTRELRRA